MQNMKCMDCMAFPEDKAAMLQAYLALITCSCPSLVKALCLKMSRMSAVRSQMRVCWEHWREIFLS